MSQRSIPATTAFDRTVAEFLETAERFNLKNWVFPDLTLEEPPLQLWPSQPPIPPPQEDLRWDVIRHFDPGPEFMRTLAHLKERELPNPKEFALVRPEVPHSLRHPSLTHDFPITSSLGGMPHQVVNSSHFGESSTLFRYQTLLSRLAEEEWRLEKRSAQAAWVDAFWEKRILESLALQALFLRLDRESRDENRYRQIVESQLQARKIHRAILDWIAVQDAYHDRVVTEQRVDTIDVDERGIEERRIDRVEWIRLPPDQKRIGSLPDGPLSSTEEDYMARTTRHGVPVNHPEAPVAVVFAEDVEQRFEQRAIKEAEVAATVRQRQAFNSYELQDALAGTGQQASELWPDRPPAREVRPAAQEGASGAGQQPGAIQPAGSVDSEILGKKSGIPAK